MRITFIHSLLIVLITSVGQSCNKTFHRDYGHWTKKDESTVYITHRSSGLSHRVYGDIAFSHRKSTIRDQVKAAGLGGVIFYGKSEIPPFYEYYILLDPKIQIYPASFDYMKDTIIAGRRVVMLGNGLSDRVPEQDMLFVLGSLKLGKE